MRPESGRVRARVSTLRLVLLLVTTCVIGPAARAAAQQPWTWAGYFELVASPGGPPDAPIAAYGTNRTSRHPLSQDGRYVVFESDAPNLSGPAGVTTIYRRDRITGMLILVQTGYVRNAALSADGLHVAYEQCAAGFASPCQIYARDLRNGLSPPMLVSSTVSGAAGNGDSVTPTLSLNGRYAVYVTNAQNLSNDALRRKQIIWRDRDANGDGIYDQVGAVTVQTVTVNGAQFGNGDSDTPEVSDDGRLVAFRSAASNLVAGDTNAMVDVFLRDRALNTTRRLNLRPGNVQSPFPVPEPHISMSGNGQFVAFASADPLLTSTVADGNASLDVFVYQGTPTLLRVDVGRAGNAVVPGNGPTGWATFNEDGRYLSLQSAATNAPFLCQTGSVQVYAVDRQLQAVTRISGVPDGTEPDAPSVQPSITAGGSLVLFTSSATTFTGVATPAFPQIHAAARLNVTPSQVRLPRLGDQATVRVAAHTYTRLLPYTDEDGSWLNLSLAANPPDNNLLTLSAPENTGAERTTTIRIGTRTVTVTQDGMQIELTGVSPAAGPMSGGTPVTIHGSGFVAGMTVNFGAVAVPATYVDAATLTAVTPAYPTRQPVMVVVEGPDRSASLDGAFTFLDDTPPVLIGYAAGQRGVDDWYTSDVTISWGWWDEQSPVTTSCADTVIAQDTVGTTVACTVTSEGGSTTASGVVQRDATPPVVTVTSPTAGRLYDRGQTVASTFTCADTTSGVSTCGMAAPPGSPIDTAVPGWRTFSAAATDQAGNLGTASVEYAVSTGVCTAPSPGLTTWLRFDGDLLDVMAATSTANSGMPPDVFVSGRSGRAYKFVPRSTGALLTYHGDRLDFSNGMSIAFWLRPEANNTGYLVHNFHQYRIQRNGDGTITWYLYRTSPEAHDTGTSTTIVPLNEWSHVVLTFEAGVVKLYVNGRLDRSWTVTSATLRSGVFSSTQLRIGGDDASGLVSFVGILDELQLGDRAMTDADVEALYLSGAAGTCVPAPTSLVVAPITAIYAAGTYQVVATLRDAGGAPLPGKPVRLTQNVVPWNQMAPTTTLVTDNGGEVRWDAPFSASVGTYTSGLYASFAGDLEHAYSNAGSVTVVVRQATPVITWAAPAPITYPSPLGAATLNATMNVPGSVWYDPDFGQVLHAGIHTVTAHARPSDWTNYGGPTLSRQLEVRKAIPNVTITGGTFTYNGQPHPATASATEYRGLPLTPLTITYDGMPTPPVNAGVYTAVASFPGDADHEPRSVSATITIQKQNASVTFGPFPLTVTYDGQPHAVTASFSGIGVSFGQRPVTYAGSPTPPVNAGVYPVSATFEGDANHNPYTATANLWINPAVPTVTIGGGPFAYDGQPHGALVTVTGLPGETVPGALTVTYGPNGSGGTAPPVNADYHYVTASVAAAGNYAAASASGSMIITKAPVTITIVANPVTYDGQNHFATVTGTGGGGLPITPIGITYNGLNTTPQNAGSYAVHAWYTGNGNHQAASADSTLVILRASPTFSWSTPPPIAYPAALSGAQLYASANASGTFAYTPAAGTVLEPGTHTLSATFTSTNANFEDGTVSTSLAVLRATPAISVGGGTFYYDGQPHPASSVSATGVGGVALAPVTVTYDGSADAPVNAGTYAVVATFDGDGTHAPATATATLTINKSYPSISWNPPFTFTYGTPLGAAHLNATASVPGTFTYTPAAGTVLDASYPSTRVLQVSFTPDDSQNYVERTISRSVWVYKANPTMGATGGAFGYDGQPHAGSGSATGVGGVVLTPVTLTYNSSPELPVVPGTYTVRAAFAGDTNYNASVALATIVISRAPATVAVTGRTFAYDGQPHAAAATATGVGGVALSPVTVTYNGSSTIPVGTGTYAVVATFAGDANHTAATGSATITIGKATPVLTWAAPASLPYGPTLDATQLNAQASVPGTFSYSPAPANRLPAGTHTLTATFTPADATNYLGGTVTTSITIVPTPLEIRAIDTARAYGSSLAFTAAFSGMASGETVANLSGTLVFTTTATTSSLVGTYAVMPGGLSSPNYVTTFVPGSLSIVKAPVTTTLATSPTPSGLDMPITFTATVTAALGAPTAPTGAVRFFDGATLLGTATLSGDTATLLTGGLAAGTHAIEARYDGDASFDVGTRTATHVVNAAAATPAITITSSRQPASIGQSVTVTATITVAATGTIAFYDGGTLLGSGSIASGRATLTASSLAAGSHAITARFQGTASAPPAISPVFVQTVNAGGSWKDRTSTMSLASSANPSTLGAAVTLTATVSGSSGAPAGRILFMVDGLVVGDPTGVAVTTVSSSASQAVLALPALTGGRHNVTATYLGSSNYRGSTGSLTQTVN